MSRWLFLALLLLPHPAWAQVQEDPRPISWQNCSLGGGVGGASKIATGGTAVSLTKGVIPPGPQLRGIFVQNPSTASESLFVEIAVGATASTAAGTSLELQAGQMLTEGPGTIGNSAISFNAATTGHLFSCKWGS